MIKKKLLLQITLCILFVSGCASMSGPSPEISLVNIEFSDVTFFETTAVIDVRVENQQPNTLLINGASYNIEINGIKIGRGTSDQKLSIPRFGSATQQVKVHISNLSMMSNIQKLVESKDFEYKIEGTLYRDGGFGFAGTEVETKQRFQMPINQAHPFNQHINQP
ncbi:MAG: LEA type 2 family protein [bacterium]|nr:LEA type 2 family protein [bacterium]